MVTKQAGNSKPGFPLVFKAGQAKAKIYKTPSNGCNQFTVCYYLGTKRVRESFSDLDKAKVAAQAAAAMLCAGELNVLSLQGEDRASYVRAMEFIRPTGVALEWAAMQFAACHKLLGDIPLVDAAKFFVKHHGVGLPKKTVGEVVEELVASKDEDGMSPVYLKDLKNRLGRFETAVTGPIQEATVTVIEEFLRGLKLSGRSRNNYRRSIGTLLYFAEARGYLPRGDGRIEQVAVAKEASGEIEVFTPEELRTYFRHARDEMIPFLAISAFAGLRNAEVCRLDWKDVRLDDGFIEVKAAKSKTASRRLVPVTDNLRDWLGPVRKESGLICSHENMPNQIGLLAGRAKLPWKHNALRHSFISYRVAAIQNVNQVALEAGNSAAMIFKHYRELVRPAAAQEWFGIGPGYAGKD